MGRTVRELLADCGVPTAPGGHEHVRRGWVQVDCPRCTPGAGRWRLGINIRGLYANCWSCGRVPLGWALREATGESWDTVKGWLKDLDAGGEDPLALRAPGKLKMPALCGPLLPAHLDYLAARGLEPGPAARLWGLLGTGPGAPIGWRVVLPYHLHGRTVSWTARAVSPHAGLRYRTAASDEEAVPAKHLLYGEDFARHAVVVTEGPLDAIAVGPGGVATAGLSYTAAQLLRIARFPVRVVCLDADAAAQDRARRLCTELAAYPGRTVRVQLETGKDAVRADRREVARLRRLYLD